MIYSFLLRQLQRYRANPNPRRVTLTNYYDVAIEREGEMERRTRESSDDVTVVEDRTLLSTPHRLTSSARTVCSVRPVAADQPHSALPRSPPCSDSCRPITVSLCSGNSAKVIINNRLLLYFALVAFPWRRKQNNARAVRDYSWRRWLDVSRLCELFLSLTLPLLWIINAVDSMNYWNGYGFTRTQDLVGSISHIFNFFCSYLLT